MASSSSNTAHNLASSSCVMTRKHSARPKFTVEDALLKALENPSFELNAKSRDCANSRTSGLSPRANKLCLGPPKSVKKSSPLFCQQMRLSVYDLPDDDKDCQQIGSCASTPSLFADSLREFQECKQCVQLRDSGLDEWMDHLGSQHPLPTIWPSCRVNNSEADRQHPYTSVVDSHKKKKKNIIPRPLNSFMIFAQYIRRLTLHTYPDAPNVHISQRVGKLWRNLPGFLRDAYTVEARHLQNLHIMEFPDYKYRPRKRSRADTLLSETRVSGSGVTSIADTVPKLTLHKLNETVHLDDQQTSRTPQNLHQNTNSPLAVHVDILDICSSPSLSRSSECRPFDWGGDGFDEPGFQKRSFNQESYDSDATLTSLINAKDEIISTDFNLSRKRKIPFGSIGCGGYEDYFSPKLLDGFSGNHFNTLVSSYSQPMLSSTSVPTHIIPPRPIKWDPDFEALQSCSQQTSSLMDVFAAESIKQEAVAFEEKLLRPEEVPKSSMYNTHLTLTSNHAGNIPGQDHQGDNLDYPNTPQSAPQLPSIETWTFAKSSPPR